MTEISPVTIKDVATLAGISICTASRALRGLPGVSESTRAKAHESAEKLRYRVPCPAQSSNNRSGAVAVVVPTTTTWYFSHAAETAQEIIADAGLDPVLISLRGQEHIQSQLFDDPGELAQTVDGFLMIDVDLTSQQTAALSSSQRAVASVGMHNVPWDNVGIDNVAAAKAATNRLLSLGHWDIAFLAGGQTGNGKTQATAGRRQGFEMALAEHDAVAHPDWVINAGYTLEGGRQAMSELIQHRDIPTAVFAGCDEAAFGALMAIKDHGLSCPQDISLIGIDDHPISRVLGLTTITQPVADEAAFAASLLLDRLQRPTEIARPWNYYLPTVLTDRATTKRHLPHSARRAQEKTLR